MARRRPLQADRGTTLIEILVAVALLLIIFLFITADLMQSSRAENVDATRSASISAANYLMGVMQNDSTFWQSDWTTGPGGDDPCNNPWPPYTDNITSPTWHPAPACTPNASSPGLFPELAGLASPNAFAYMWNAQVQAGDPDAAQLTVWVQMNENGNDVYELHSTRTNIHPPASPAGIKPPPATACPTNCTTPTPVPPHSPPPDTPTPKPSASPTTTPKPTPKPSPSPVGTFE
jgi:prepilin-type N-terminal cleavage/methylation domain-containing protein